MKMRASLRRRVIDDKGTQPPPDDALDWLEAHGIKVLRIGRWALSVEAEPGALASALETEIEPGKSTVLEIGRGTSRLGTWFDLLEVTPRPEYFRPTPIAVAQRQE